MRSLYTFLLILLCTTGALAQDKLFKIDYKIDFGSSLSAVQDSSSDDFSKALIEAFAEMFAQEDKPQIQGWVNNEHLRVETNIMGSNIQITDKIAAISYGIYPESETYYEVPVSTDKLIVTNTDDDVQVLHAADFPLSFVDGETQEIAGFKCKLATLTIPVDEQAELEGVDNRLEIWYTEEIPSLYWGEYDYLRLLPGAALSISTNGIGIIASKVEQVEFEQQLFEVPDGYTLSYSAIDDNSEEVEDTDLGHGLYSFTDPETYQIGIRDDENNIITDAIYSYITVFEGDYAVVVNTDGLYGIINTEGKEVVPCAWSYLNVDSETGYVFFSENDKMGAMTMDQKLIIPANYEYLSLFSDGVAIFSDNEKNGLIDLKGKIILPADYANILEYSKDYVILYDEEGYRLLDIKTKKLSQNYYTYLTSANEGNLFVAIQEDKYGYIDAKEKVVIPFKFNYATPFQEGIAEVSEGEEEFGKYINTKGEYVTLSEEE